MISISRAIIISLLAAMLVAANGCATRTYTIATAQTAAQINDASACYYLAKHYARGEGVPHDDLKAFTFMRKAAELGSVYAQNDLGTYYAKGIGTPQDFSRAAIWYQRAAEGGDVLGQYSYGMACLRGRGVTTNVSEGLRWLNKSARQNGADAMAALGYVYLNGQAGVDVDCRRAKYWFEKALAKGRVSAANPLGFIWESGGNGIAPDLTRAMACYRQAAERNDGEGQLNVGRLFYKGAGVKRDLVAAYMWFYLSAHNGDLVANHYLRELDGSNPLAEPLLTQDQLNQAIQQAAEFLKTHRPKNQANA